MIDSTTITLGKSRMPWAPYHGELLGIKLNVAYTTETEMPLHVKKTTGLLHDRPADISLAHSNVILV
ncbi:hypothetical protein [Jeotgalibacillus terrae]|uniref:hypothetical protein n=1 Tax=Jeotgalibacillus terrae TaxID=587735 RepID=UPI0036D3A7B0